MSKKTLIYAGVAVIVVVALRDRITQAIGQVDKLPVVNRIPAL